MRCDRDPAPTGPRAFHCATSTLPCSSSFTRLSARCVVPRDVPVFRALRLLRPIARALPESVKGAFANCGGTNADPTRFAGRLAEHDLSDEDFIKVLHALILANGTRKSTAPARNREVMEA